MVRKEIKEPPVKKKPAKSESSAQPPAKKSKKSPPTPVVVEPAVLAIESDDAPKRDHNKMVWLAREIKKDNCPAHFLTVFQQQEKMSKVKGSALVNECVVRDPGTGKWMIDCEKPIFKDRGL